MLLAVVSTLILLLALVAHLLRIVLSGPREAPPMLVMGLGAALLSSMLTLVALRALVMQVAFASRALRLGRLSRQQSIRGSDPEDERNELLAETHHTLDYLNAVIKRLEREAATDELTGMLNRRAGERRLQAALDAPRGTEEQLAVALLDVDGLKAVNDGWGHAAGDAALKHMASKLIQHVGDRGWVARWGGDEFLVVLVEKGEDEPAETLLMAMARELAASPLPVARTGEARLGVSWGLAWPTSGEASASVVERADSVLYRAKRRPRGRVRTSGLVRTRRWRGTRRAGAVMHNKR